MKRISHGPAPMYIVSLALRNSIESAEIGLGKCFIPVEKIGEV